MADILPTFVLPSSVKAKKMQLDPSMRSLNATVLSCRGLAPEKAAAWGAFYQSWLSFYETPEGFFTAGTEANQADDFARRLAAWQQLIATSNCQLSEPLLAAPRPQGELLQTLAISAAVIFGSYALISFLGEAKAATNTARLAIESSRSRTTRKGVTS